MTSSKQSESSLVREAQAGDSQALARLFSENEGVALERIRRRLSPAVRRKVADSDVLQETLAVAACRLDQFQFRGTGSFQAWLAAIAENAARRAVQRHAGTKKRDVRAEVSRDARAETAQHRGREDSPSRVAMGDEMRGRVADALRQMPEDYRTVVQLLQHRKVTIAEAAELMGRSVNAVKKLHARALTDLAGRLGIDGRKRS